MRKRKSVDAVLREILAKLRDVDQKLEHLIRSRKYNCTQGPYSNQERDLMD